VDAVRLGQGIKALRQRRGWRQEDLALAADVSRSVVARIEQGLADRVPWATIRRVAAPFGARLVVRLDWNGEQLDRLIDARHAALVDVVLAELTAHGWICVPEATFNVFGERGSVDVLAFHPATRVLLIVEVKTAIPEIGNLLAPLDRKRRLGPQLAAVQGWTVSSVARLLVVADTSTNRRRIAAHGATFRAAFPVRGCDARRWIASPAPESGWSGLWITSGGHDQIAVTAG
jgi:transcriptional regulator with XRE-family HTH domain